MIASQPLPWHHPGVLVATGLGLGYLRPAPGTWGSLLGLPLALGLSRLAWPWAMLAGAALLPLAFWACRCGAAHFGEKDAGGIVIDEIVAVPLAAAPLWLGAPALWTLPVALGLFRLFDIAKPGPVGWLDRRGDTLGVLGDDLVAGLIAGGLGLAAFAWV